jgi:hypothetical protein
MEVTIWSGKDKRKEIMASPLSTLFYNERIRFLYSSPLSSPLLQERGACTAVLLLSCRRGGLGGEGI